MSKQPHTHLPHRDPDHSNMLGSWILEMTRVRISFTLDPRDMLFCLRRDFSFVSASVACVTLEKASGFEPSYGEVPVIAIMNLIEKGFMASKYIA